MILDPVFTARAAACRHSHVATMGVSDGTFIPVYACSYPKALASGYGSACARGLVNTETGKPFECVWFKPLPAEILNGGGK